MAAKNVTNDEIMTALTQFAGDVDRRFDGLEADVSELKHDVAGLKSDVADQDGVKLKYD